MRLMAIEPNEFHARAGLREKVNVSITSDSFSRKTPAIRAERAADGVAVIPIMGVMLSMPDALDDYFGGYANIHGIRRAVESAAADRTVKSIILHINSPGGDVDGLAELGDAVREASRRKNITAVIQGMGASAAYYVACCASSIVAGRMDLIGSIGTIMTVYDVSKGYAERGIRTVPIATGEYKATGTAGTELTGPQEKYLQSIVDGFFQDFRRTVVGGRRLGPEEWTAVSDGRVFLTADAKRLGLIDEIGTLGGTVNRMLGESLSPMQKTRARVQASLCDVLPTAAEVSTRRAARQRAALQQAALGEAGRR